jgi:hypothetical protein
LRAVAAPRSVKIQSEKEVDMKTGQRQRRRTEGKRRKRTSARLLSSKSSRATDEHRRVVLAHDFARRLVRRGCNGRHRGSLTLVENFGEGRGRDEGAREGNRGFEGEVLLAVKKLHRREVGKEVHCEREESQRKGRDGEKGRKRTGNTARDGKLRDDAERRESFEVLVAFEDEVEVLLGRSDPKSVKSHIALPESVLSRRRRLLLRLRDELRVLLVGVVDGVAGRLLRVAEVTNDALEGFGGRVRVGCVLVEAGDGVPLADDILGSDLVVDGEL